MKSTNDCDQSRRRFLRDAATTAPAVVAVAAVPTQATATPTADEQGDAKQSEGYRLTQHILDYYKSASV